MAFTKEELDQILAALQKKAPNPGKCTICGNDKWEVGEELVTLVLQDNIKNLKLTGPFLPCIPVTCKNCGNTHFLNLLTLGLRDLLDKQKEKKTKVE